MKRYVRICDYGVIPDRGNKTWLTVLIGLATSEADFIIQLSRVRCEVKENSEFGVCSVCNLVQCAAQSREEMLGKVGTFKSGER